jgi:MurNAc alpha-1-phosphate uridylyltransferase
MGDSLAAEESMGHASDREIVGIVLSAGAGIRLGPLGSVRPKPLCPIGNVPLLDLAVDRVHRCVGAVAVNLHHGAEEILRHLESDGAGIGSEVHVSIEKPEALGTAGAIANLLPWIDGRDVLVVNADAWCTDPLGELLADRSPERVTVLAHETDAFGPTIGVVASVLPWSFIRDLEPVPTGLYEVVWRDAHERGVLDVVRSGSPFVDCGTPSDYLRANMLAVGLAGDSIIDPSARIGEHARIIGSVIGPGARIEGSVTDSVVWADQMVGIDEVLDRAIRATPELTLRPTPRGGSHRA